jgi:GntR family transcriptional regulator
MPVENRLIVEAGSAARAVPSAAAQEPLFKPSERFHLDPNSPVPLYHQMEQIMLDRIESEGAVGRRLPREMDLVKIFGVSRITIKKVTDSLAAKGLIRRQRAIGTHLVSLGVTEELGRLTSYTEQMRARGLKVSTLVLQYRPSGRAPGPRIEWDRN